MDSQQSELQFALGGGGKYQVGEYAASWQRRSDDEKIIDLSFRGKDFEITQEGSGPGGRPRFLINGIRTSDDKLFQGRALLELVRKLNDNWGSFREIPARLERMERKLDRLIESRRPAPKTKLCLEMMTPAWPQQRYIPKAALGGFARVPIQMIAASQRMAAGEYRLLQAVLFCAQGTGLLTAGKKRLGKLAKVGERHIKEYLRSLCNRLILRPTGRILQYGVREHELLTHPYLSEDGENGGQKSAKGGQICAARGATVAPLKNDDDKILKKDHHDELKTLGNSIPDAPSNASTSSSFFVEGHQKHQSQSARDHVKWPEYAAYCGSQKGKRAKDGRVHDGMPTEKGFWKWLLGQKSQWRNKRKQTDYIDGFVLDGKFLTPEEANQIGAHNPRLLDEGRFRPARKGHDGKFVIISEPKR